MRTYFESKLVKITLRILLFVLCIIIILNFIPIKFARKTKKYVLKKNEYLVEVILKTIYDENWLAYKSLSINRGEAIDVNLNGNVPFNTLNPKVFNMYTRRDNQYIITGELTTHKKYGLEGFGEIEVESWEIVYPIYRQSFWEGLTPKSYLTVYDFNWSKILKDWSK